MPRIAARVTQAGGGDFSGLYGSTARGMAAGLQTARDLEERELRMTAAERAMEEEEEDREREESERRGAHAYYDQQFSGLSKDPLETDAFARLPVEIKAFEVERRRKLAQTERQMKTLRRSLDFVGSHPRGKRYAEEIQMMGEAGAPPQQLAPKLMEAERELREFDRVQEEAMEKLVEVEQFIGLPSRAISSDTRAKLKSLYQRMQQQLERGQDPNWPDPMDARDLEEFDKEFRMSFPSLEDLEEIRQDEHDRLLEQLMEERGGLLEAPTRDPMYEPPPDAEPGAGNGAAPVAPAAPAAPKKGVDNAQAGAASQEQQKPAPAAAVGIAAKTLAKMMLRPAGDEAKGGQKEISFEQWNQLRESLGLTPEQMLEAQDMARQENSRPKGQPAAKYGRAETARRNVRL